MKRIFAVIVAAPILALFVGFGTLAIGVADTWDDRNTDVLISNLTMVCGLGTLVIALVLSVFLGLAFYTRWQRTANWEEMGTWSGNRISRRQPTYRQAPSWLESPPMIAAKEEPKGKLHSTGSNSYEDLDMTLFDGRPDDVDWNDRS